MLAPPPALLAAAIADELAEAGVAYVLTGSVAALVYGAPVEPRHFDVTPELSPANLERLAEVLASWGARAAAALDGLVETPLGLVDVVRARAGRFDDLFLRALHVERAGRSLLVAHPDDLLAALPHRPRQLAAARDRFAAGELVPVLPF